MALRGSQVWCVISIVRLSWGLFQLEGNPGKPPDGRGILINITFCSFTSKMLSVSQTTVDYFSQEWKSLKWISCNTGKKLTDWQTEAPVWGKRGAQCTGTSCEDRWQMNNQWILGRTYRAEWSRIFYYALLAEKWATESIHMNFPPNP